MIGSRYDPLPGWMDNLNGPAGLWAAAYKGILRAYPLGDAVMDTIPVDFATKIMLLASWKKGIGKPIRCKLNMLGKRKGKTGGILFL